MHYAVEIITRRDELSLCLEIQRKYLQFQCLDEWEKEREGEGEGEGGSGAGGSLAFSMAPGLRGSLRGPCN